MASYLGTGNPNRSPEEHKGEERKDGVVKGDQGKRGGGNKKGKDFASRKFNGKSPKTAAFEYTGPLKFEIPKICMNQGVQIDQWTEALKNIYCSMADQCKRLSEQLKLNAHQKELNSSRKNLQKLNSSAATTQMMIRTADGNIFVTPSALKKFLSVMKV